MNDPSPPSPGQFLSFFGSFQHNFCQIIGFRPKFRGWHPSRLENPGSTTDVIHAFSDTCPKAKKQQKFDKYFMIPQQTLPQEILLDQQRSPPSVFHCETFQWDLPAIFQELV